jgi:hypothetical protein
MNLHISRERILGYLFLVTLFPYVFLTEQSQALQVSP